MSGKLGQLRNEIFDLISRLLDVLEKHVGNVPVFGGTNKSVFSSIRTVIRDYVNNMFDRT